MANITDVMKYRQVLEAMRTQILNGAFAGNRRLPTRSEIGKQFGVGMATVQKALDALTRDGFLRARPGAGTYVVEYPPHECHFGLVLPHEAYSSSQIHDDAVRQAAKELENGTTIRFRQYGISNAVQYRQGVDRLTDDVTNHRLAGIISPFFFGDLLNTPVCKTPGMPKVFCAEVDADLTFSVGPGEWMQPALEYVLSRGCRRIAHLQLEVPGMESPQEFAHRLQRMGLETQPYWVQRVTIGHSASPAANLVHLLMQLEGEKRPDALVVYDDTLLEPVVAGLLSCNIKVPADLEVLSLANFPSPRPEGVPVRRLGYDWFELLSKSIEVIRLARQGQRPEQLLIPAVFEEDLPVRRHVGASQEDVHIHWGERFAQGLTANS